MTSKTSFSLVPHDRNNFFNRYTPHSSNLNILLLLILNTSLEYDWIWCRLKHVLFGHAVTHSSAIINSGVRGGVRVHLLIRPVIFILSVCCFINTEVNAICVLFFPIRIKKPRLIVRKND